MRVFIVSLAPRKIFLMVIYKKSNKEETLYEQLRVHHIDDAYWPGITLQPINPLARKRNHIFRDTFLSRLISTHLCLHLFKDGYREW
jgi:hypothetical protein